jgi:hypothetical protein
VKWRRAREVRLAPATAAPFGSDLFASIGASFGGNLFLVIGPPLTVLGFGLACMAAVGARRPTRNRSLTGIDAALVDNGSDCGRPGHPNIAFINRHTVLGNDHVDHEGLDGRL